MIPNLPAKNCKHVQSVTSVSMQMID